MPPAICEMFKNALREFPDAEQIRLVQDNLSTHTPASLYAAFPAPEARRLAKRFEWQVGDLDLDPRGGARDGGSIVGGRGVDCRRAGGGSA